MNEKHEDQSGKESDVYWSFRCEGCGFVVLKLCTDKEPCPMCNKKLVKTYFQFFN